MAAFFLALAWLSSLGLFSTLLTVHLHTVIGLNIGTHMIFGLSSAVFAALVHCLVFAIFTGSGKDTRLVVQGLNLDPTFLKTTRDFKKTVFPPAMQAIGLLLLMVILGGAWGAAKSRVFAQVFSVAHPLLAWLTFFFNVRVFIIEHKAVAENSALIRKVNRSVFEVSKALEPSEDARPTDFPASALTELEWNQTVYGLGRFLSFVGYNIWLPYIYLKYAVAAYWVHWLPFLVVSILLMGAGWWLKRKARGVVCDSQI
jgi:hypothetical protein